MGLFVGFHGQIAQWLGGCSYILGPARKLRIEGVGFHVVTITTGGPCFGLHQDRQGPRVWQLGLPPTIRDRRINVAWLPRKTGNVQAKRTQTQNQSHQMVGSGLFQGLADKGRDKLCVTIIKSPSCSPGQVCHEYSLRSTTSDFSEQTPTCCHGILGARVLPGIP